MLPPSVDIRVTDKSLVAALNRLSSDKYIAPYIGRIKMNLPMFRKVLITEIGNAIRDEAKANLIRHNSIRTGRLLNSIRVRIIGDHGVVEATAQDPNDGIYYGNLIELGAEAKYVAFDIVKEEDNKYGHDIVLHGDIKGYAPKPFLKPAITVNKQKAISKAVRRLLNK